MPPRLRRPAPRRERGLAAIEFALVFPIFFLLFYGLVNWGLILTLQESLSFAAQGAARAALKADPANPANPDDPDSYHDTVEQLARTEAGATLAWMPSSWKDRVLIDVDNTGVEVTVLPPDENGVEWVQVVVDYPNYSTTPILPLLNFGGATFPPVPTQLVGQATLRL